MKTKLSEINPVNNKYCCKELFNVIEDNVINQDFGNSSYFLSNTDPENISRHYIVYCPFCGDKKHRRIVCGFCKEKGLIYEFTSMKKTGEHIVQEHSDRIEDEE